MSTAALPAIASATAVLIAGVIVLAVYDAGPFSFHMTLHIASMNIAAPLLGAILARLFFARGARPAFLWAVTLVQIVVLWIWHAPVLQRTAQDSMVLQLFMHGSLFFVAMLFWLVVLKMSGSRRWHAVPALLLTGKLACLLAALLIFAPRTLYDSAVHLMHAVERLPVTDALDDQHLAGLLMITACPLSYLVASVVIAAQIIGKPEAAQAASPSRTLSTVS